MNRAQALDFVHHAVDDALAERSPADAPEGARLVGWMDRDRPTFVAVWSYLGVRLDDNEASELAMDLLREKRLLHGSQPRLPDYVL
jgi:hypothetical protein